MRRGLLVSVLVVSTFRLLATAQQGNELHFKLSRTLDGMSSTNWRDRKSAFNEMPSLADVKQDSGEADRLKVGLIHLLAVENAGTKETVPATEARPENTTEEHDEEFSDYYGNLIGVVADLNDERAIPALLGAIGTGEMAGRGIAKFGDKALGPLLDLLHDSDNLVRSSVLFTIRDLLEMHICNTSFASTHKRCHPLIVR